MIIDSENLYHDLAGERKVLFSEWFRTSERLPQRSGLVLVSDGKIVGAYHWNSAIQKFMDRTDYPFSPDQLAYWMPLPNAPEK